ncbi:MAG: ATP-binding cassette domain-containing protein, partial [Proteobacteria bacterium]|nr:ATP-binding cassette domain-containing protein [Pseudomonadota bacterium]
GMHATKDYEANAALTERRPRSTAVALRSLLHEAKGMLHQAGIQIGTSYSIDMSHHYGPERFRQHGAIIVNLINREYCKKLIIVLPGQSHPMHRHMVKEESFQLLHGDLQITRDGDGNSMRPGDIALVERGMERAEARERIADLFARVRLPRDLWDGLPILFSGGEQQRVNLVRALAVAPRLLLLDEPTASLSPDLQAEVVTLIGEARDRGTTLVGVMHDTDLLNRLSDQVIVLDQGRRVA